MCRPLLPIAFLVLGAVLVPATRALGQEPVPADSAAADTLGADTTGVVRPLAGNDPRLTWLGDTLAQADSVAPKFSDLPEVWPDSLLDIYVVGRPGAWPAWTLTGSALLGRGAYNLLDVLESEFPVLAQDLGGSGLAAHIGSPHGTGTNVQVVIDGVPAANAMFASWDLRQIPLEGIAKVAWYPGPQAAAFGGNGTGGVLSITTRRSIAPASRSMLGFHLGSFDAQAFSASFGRPITRRGDFFVGANFDAIEGFLGSGDFTRNQTVTRLGWRLGSRHRIEIARRGDGLSGNDTRSDSTGVVLRGEEDADNTAVNAFYSGGFGPLTARLHAQRDKREQRSAFEFGGGALGIVGLSETRDVRGSLEARIGERFVVWGSGGWTEEDASSTATAFFLGSTNVLDPADGDTVPAGIDPRERMEWGGGAGFGGPADRFAGNAAVRTLSFEGLAGSEVAWQAEGVARPGAGVTLRAFAGSAARQPDLAGQAILARQALLGVEIHPGLAADPAAVERWTELRGEATWTSGAWHFGGRAWRATGDGAFVWLPPTLWMRFDPTLGTFPIGEAGFNAFDVLDVTVTGLEADAVLPLPYGIEGRLHGRWLGEKADELDQQLPYVPEVQALGQLRYARRFFPSRDLLLEARVTGRFTGERTTLGGDTLDPTLVGDLLVQTTIVHVTIYVSFKNFTDQEVVTEDGVGLPGLEAFLGLNWRFRN
jgi:hypothetical protein